jgi:hypothetical protein
VGKIKGLLDRKARLVLKVLKVRKVSRENKESRDRLALKAMRDLKGLRASKVLKGSREKLVLLAQGLPQVARQDRSHQKRATMTLMSSGSTYLHLLLTRPQNILL